MPLNMFTNASTCDPLSEQFEEINGPVFPWRPGRREPGKRNPAPCPSTADPGIRYLGCIDHRPGSRRRVSPLCNANLNFDILVKLNS